MNNKAVVLIHGLLMNSMIMSYIKSEIRKKGYQTYCFNYKSQQYSEKTLEDFNGFLKGIEEKDIYIIGHSMGGLLARNYIDKYPHNDSIKSIVTIATPHNQSLCGKIVSNTFLSKILGSAGESGITKNVKDWKNSIPIGCIAGISHSILSTNVMLMLKYKEEDSDGTVFIKEAILNNCTDSIILNGSHTGLLFKKYVAQQCIYFIENCRFNK